MRSSSAGSGGATSLQLLAEVEERFETARFPFRHNRAIPRITVRGSAEGVGLDPGVRRQQPWPDATKRALIDQGYALADAELRRAGIDQDADEAATAAAS